MLIPSRRATFLGGGWGWGWGGVSKKHNKIWMPGVRKATMITIEATDGVSTVLPRVSKPLFLSVCAFRQN